MQELVLTTQQRMRLHRDQEIAARYRELREENPGAPDRRLVETIATNRTEAPMSPAGVRLALVRSGVITPNSGRK